MTKTQIEQLKREYPSHIIAASRRITGTFEHPATAGSLSGSQLVKIFRLLGEVEEVINE